MKGGKEREKKKGKATIHDILAHLSSCPANPIATPAVIQ